MVQTRQKRGKETDKENADSPSKDPKPSSTQVYSSCTAMQWNLHPLIVGSKLWFLLPAMPYLPH